MARKRPSHGGGWHAVRYTYKMGKRAGGTLRLFSALRKSNTCKACAFGMKGMRNELGQGFQVCKKAMQAQSQDMLPPISQKFFEDHDLDAMKQMSGRELELLGRLTFPIHKKPGDNRFVPIGWDDALSLLVNRWMDTDPQRLFIYVSGRSSNEAAFLIQLLGRAYGTNHINNCSYYCHQASGVGLSSMLGSGTATVTLADVEKSDLIVVAGANPSSNHPRFMTHLMNLRKRKGNVVVINPFREVGLERFAIPSHMKSLLFPTEIANLYIQPHCGGDMSFFKAIAARIHQLGQTDLNFLRTNCNNVEEFLDDLEKADVDRLLSQSGVSREDLDQFVDLLLQARNPIFAWAMGLTHQRHGVETVQMLTNLALMVGAIGREGSGLLPLRGHSNVQGVGTVGVVPRLKPSVIDALAKHLGINVPSTDGYDTFSAMKAAENGEIDFALFLGGNLYGANPASKWAGGSISNIPFTCQLSTTLNLGHIHGQGKEALILPVRARDEERQGTTQESMFNYVRYSVGGQSPPISDLPSETEILVDIGRRLVPDVLDWDTLSNHDRIRDFIGKTIPGMQAISNVKEHEFTIEGRILHTPQFNTKNKKAHLKVLAPPDARPPPGKFNLTTFRSEGQFNTIIYDDEDVYRGSTHRNVIFINSKDLLDLGIKDGDLVKVVSDFDSVVVEAFEAPIRRGNVAMFFPEGNKVIPPIIDPLSKTPVFKRAEVAIHPIND
ncbi:MAG: histidine kinase [Methanobacteriota archaeon]|nr:MAG: histidine kinase [Euryarchaeota archaeon]